MATLDIVRYRLKNCNDKLLNLQCEVTEISGGDSEYSLTDKQYEKIVFMFLAVRNEITVIQDILGALKDGGK